MSYQDVADMAEDWGLRMRLIACAAQEHHENPVVFVEEQIWRIAGQPGWGDAWAQAKLTHADTPDYEIGKDDTVVTDGMIRSSMQAIVGGVTERADRVAAAAAAAAVEQARIEHDRHMATFTAQRDVELANPINPIVVPAAPIDPGPVPKVFPKGLPKTSSKPTTKESTP